ARRPGGQAVAKAGACVPKTVVDLVGAVLQSLAKPFGALLQVLARGAETRPDLTPTVAAGAQLAGRWLDRVLAWCVRSRLRGFVADRSVDDGLLTGGVLRLFEVLLQPRTIGLVQRGRALAGLEGEGVGPEVGHRRRLGLRRRQRRDPSELAQPADSVFDGVPEQFGQTIHTQAGGAGAEPAEVEADEAEQGAQHVGTLGADQTLLEGVLDTAHQRGEQVARHLEPVDVGRKGAETGGDIGFEKR